MQQPVAPTPRAPFHLLAKPTGSACNLACEYCFFLRKSELYPGQRQRMSDETLESYVRQLFSAHPDGEVAVAFQGGEPTLMGLDFFRRVVDLAEQFRRPGQTPAFSIQTNATLLDEAWATFLAENRFLVGVSIDGPAEVHDAYRHTGAGEPTHARVMASIELLRDAGVEWNALATVSHASEGRGVEVYEFLRDDAHATFIQFIPIVERVTDAEGTPVGHDVTSRAVSPAGYGQFLIDVFDAWVMRDVGEVYVQDFDVALAAWAHEGHPVCVHAPTCGRALALEFNGDVYSCDHFVDPAHLLGNLAETPLGALVEGETQRAFGNAKAAELPTVCHECPAVYACNGGCPKDRFVAADGGGPDANYLCEGYLAFYRHVDRPMHVMAKLLEQGRAPSEIVGLAAQAQREQFAGVGRNDPCPCGSGRKFKHCHGQA